MTATPIRTEPQTGEPTDQTRSGDQTGSGDPTDPSDQTDPAGPARRRRLGVPVWAWLLIGAVVLLTVVVLGVAQVVRALDTNTAYDPRSTRARGTAAIAQLLDDEGVGVTTTNDVVAATRGVTADSTLVIVSADQLTTSRVRDLVSAGPARIVLVDPTAADLDRLGLDGVRPVGQVSQRIDPGCSDPRAIRSGAIFPTLSTTFTVPGGAVGCYSQAGGSLLVVTQLGGVPVTVLPDVVSNETLPLEGNAALAMNTLGQQPRLVWLMATPEATADGGPAGRPTGPALLPGWWPMLVLQLVIALVAVGLWRGRRLGPIIYERLPVRISSSETIEGHGRLYQRQEARGAAAASLRAAAIRRLAARHGHLDDPQALAEVLSARTGRPPPATRLLLTGPDPVTDQQLLDLKIDLDTLEQEAHHP